jgi:glycosyltransferase involved in cell wall biosynthesis
MRTKRYTFLRKTQAAFRASRFLIKNYPLMAYVRLTSKWRASIKDRVTIVTPTYRRLHLLREAVESVRAQTHQDWEHLIIADGHDPEIEHFIVTLQDDRIQYHYTRPTRMMGNYQRNYALRFATGEYILYLDDDNIIYRECLSAMIAGFVDDSTGHVIAPIQYGDIIMSPTPPFRFGEIDLLNYMVRRPLVERVWGQNRHFGGDYYLIDRISRISSGNLIDQIIGHLDRRYGRTHDFTLDSIMAALPDLAGISPGFQWRPRVHSRVALE